jgi:THO complex subunit 4
VYNSQALSKGMAVVAFARAGDAVAARAKYHGKIVDDRACPRAPVDAR